MEVKDRRDLALKIMAHDPQMADDISYKLAKAYGLKEEDAPDLSEMAPEDVFVLAGKAGLILDVYYPNYSDKVYGKHILFDLADAFVTATHNSDAFDGYDGFTLTGEDKLTVVICDVVEGRGKPVVAFKQLPSTLARRTRQATAGAGTAQPKPGASG